MLQYILLGLFFFSAIQAQNTLGNTPYLPWYSGSFFSFSGQNNAVGEHDLQGYLFTVANYGSYDKNFTLKSTPTTISINPQILWETGITSFLDFEIFLQSFHKIQGNKHSSSFGDMAIVLGLQLLQPTKQDDYPYLRLVIQETFPTGQYQKSDPSKKLTDISGQGSFQTQVILAIQKAYRLYTTHPFRIRVNIGATYLSPTNIKGINAYGGSIDTNGTIKPGMNATFLFSPEFSITQHWVFVFDLIYNHNFPSSFSGSVGRKGRDAIALKSQDTISLAPAIEYNFNENFGLIAGGWFSITGKRTAAFASGIISLTYVW